MSTPTARPSPTVRELLDRLDWSTSPLGSPEAWPAEVRLLVRHVLAAEFPMWVAWGPELRIVYNDAYCAILGAKHPQALAMPVRAVQVTRKLIGAGRLAEVDRFVDMGLSSAQRAAALTHRLLAFSRRQNLQPQVLNVSRLVQGMVDLVRRTVGPSIEVEVVCAVGLWKVKADISQLENAMLNLCINARDAMPDGGKLTIETANRWVDERSATEIGLEPGQYVSLSVSDTGVGMSPETVAHAFEPFFTTKPIGQGTGLGLSMIYGFAKQSGGQARIYSEPGAGTMVALYMPRSLDAESSDADAQAMPEVPRAHEGETVLVVDDEPSVRAVVVQVMVELGYATLQAANGAEALSLLAAAGRIDLMITDVGLPGGMNGRQVADAARVKRPGLKVLFITGYAENAVFSHGHLENGMEMMSKPFDVDLLARRAKTLIDAPLPSAG